MKKLNLIRTVAECLETNPGQEMTAREIGEWIVNHYPKEAEEKIADSKQGLTWESLPTQYGAEISSNRPRLLKRYIKVRATESRPRRYYWSTEDEFDALISDQGPIAPDKQDDKKRRKEADLYPMLCDYLRQDRSIYAMRIDEKRSSHSKGAGGNHWLYPDVVGMQFLPSYWEEHVRELVAQIRANVIRLWSFEVKVELKPSNVRQSYFQAVSNSSWSNFGYVVAETVEIDARVELEMLHSLHGIGLIQLDRKEPLESQVLVPARERENVDWATCNRIAKENSDFRRFTRLVYESHLTGNVRPELWR